MRLVPVNCIQEGTYLAKTIYDSNGRVLLAKGYKLTNPILKRVETSGIMSLYINDEYSDNEIEDIIKPEIRQKAVKTIKSSFDGILKQTQFTTVNPQLAKSKQVINEKYQFIDNIAKAAYDIVEEIVAQKNVLINLVDIKSMDNYTYEHSLNVTVLSLITGMELKFDKNKLVDLAVGAMLHDMGKVFMPKDILLKNGKLTDQEFSVVKDHPFNGYEYIKDNAGVSILSRNIVLQHHEKVDGTGYPDGAKGDKLHDCVKIVAIADVYDALTSDRPYRRAMSPNEAMEYIMGTADRHFDYRIVNAFLKKIVPYPPGTLIRLSNGYIGVVEEINPIYPLRPIIRVVRPLSAVSNSYIDLMKENSLVIEGIQYEAPK